MSEYRAHWRPQKDGSDEEWRQCAAIAAGNAADRARKGVKPTTKFPWLPSITKLTYGWRSTLPTMASSIFDWCRRTYSTSAPGGLYQKWANAAIKAMYGVTMGYAYGIAWATFVSFIVGHRGGSVSIKYWVLHGTPFDGCRSFDGRHRVFVNERRFNSTKGIYEYLVLDGLADHRFSWIPQGPQWWPASLLKRAMEASGIEVSYTPATA